MDNITHAALGLTVAEAAFPSCGAAGVVLAIVASELPDIDIFLGLGNPWSMVTIHRGITHSILLAPLLAAGLAGIWSWISSSSFWMLFLLALVCLLGHIGLDVLTTYGTQILEPFSKHRFGLGWVAVVDPVVTGVLLTVGVAALWLGRQHPSAAMQLGLAGLALTAGYVGLGAVEHHRAMGVIRQQTAQFGEPVAADAVPQIGTIFLWRLLYRNQDTFWLARYNSLTGSLEGQKTMPVAVDPQLVPLLSTPGAEVFRHFAGLLTWPHVEPGDLGALIIEDMRFSLPADAPLGLWALRIGFTRDGAGAAKVREMEFLQRQLRAQGPGPIRARVSPVPAVIE